MLCLEIAWLVLAVLFPAFRCCNDRVIFCLRSHYGWDCLVGACAVVACFPCLRSHDCGFRTIRIWDKPKLRWEAIQIRIWVVCHDFILLDHKKTWNNVPGIGIQKSKNRTILCFLGLKIRTFLCPLASLGRPWGSLWAPLGAKAGKVRKKRVSRREKVVHFALFFDTFS